MATIEDERHFRNEKPFCYVVATDRFLSGWGLAKGGRSIFALAVYSDEDPEIVVGKLNERSDMIRVRIVYSVKANGQPKIKLRANDHLSLRDSRTAGSYYKENENE